MFKLLSSHITYGPRIPDGSVITIIAILLVVSCVVLPLLLLNPNKIKKTYLFKPVPEADFSHLENTLKDFKVSGSTVSFSRAEGINEVNLQIAANVNNKKVGKYLNISLVDDSPVVIDFGAEIVEIAVLVISVNKKTKTFDRIVGPSQKNKIIVALFQTLSTAIGIFLFVFSGSGYISYKHIDEYNQSYAFMIISLLIFVASLVLNTILLDFVQKEKAQVLEEKEEE